MLINQYENREVATMSLRRIDKELRNLATIVDHGRQAVLEYFIKGNDGKPFHGLKNNTPVYKYDLTDGDRILYVHGSSLSYLNEEDRDSFVLVSYAPHDLQEKIAQKGSFFRKHDYVDIKDYVKFTDNKETLSAEEVECIASLFFGDFKACVIDDSEIATLTPHDLDRKVLLTKEQRNCLEEWQADNAPTLITGGAGTGKTVISIRLLEAFNTSQENSFAVYFTQSSELLKKGKNQFCSLLKIDNKEYSVETANKNIIDFFNINDYCLQQLEIPYSKLVLYNDFENHFCKNNLEVQRLCSKASISFFDVWIDIRGVIKGSLSEFWQRRMSVSQFDYPHISHLVEKGFLIRLESNPQRVKLAFSTQDAHMLCKTTDILSSEEKMSYERIISAFETIDAEMKLISLDDYLAVSNEISLFTEEQRRCVYKICEQYQQWLEREGKYDENDIAMAVLNSNNLDAYDFVIVDEVQDYTELQLFLIYNLCENKNAFIFAGDIHQIINPTVFNHERLKKLFLNTCGNESMLRVRTLSSNYRCQQGIVDAANKLSELRRKIIGKKSAEFEEKESSYDPSIISSPLRIAYNDSNLKAILIEIMKYPRIGVLVANDAARNKLISIIGKREYDDYDVPFIFTINEIKGMEYQYIVCVDVFSDFYDEWQDILADNMAKKRETKHRFYFNLIYVALTRAQYHICFLDRSPIPQIDSLLDLKVQPVFDAQKCYFTTLGNSLWDWYEQAKTHHENGVYEKAIKYYRKSGEYATQRDIIECQIGLAEANKDYVNLVKYALLIEDFSLAQKYINENTISAELKSLVEWFLAPTTRPGIIKLINANYNNFSQEDREYLYLMAKTKMRNEIKDLLNLSIIAGGIPYDK